MKLFVFFILFLYLFSNILLSQVDINDIFDIDHDKFDKTTTLTLKKPIIIEGKKQKLSLILYRNIYTKEQRNIYTKEPNTRFSKGYIYIAVYFNIESILIKNQDLTIKILLKNGDIIVPYVNNGDSQDKYFFSIENNIYKEIETDERDDFTSLSENLIETIRIENNGKKYDFDLTEEKSQLLRNYIDLLGNYKYY